MSISYEGWERFKHEHPELLLILTDRELKKYEAAAHADLDRQLFILEAFANQRIER